MSTGELPGRVERTDRGLGGGVGRRRVLTREEYLACIDTAYMAAGALSGSEESEAIWTAAEAAAQRLDVSLDEHRHIRDGDDDCKDLLALAWLAAPEGSEEERELYRALGLACERVGTTITAAILALPRPHAVYVEGDL